MNVIRSQHRSLEELKDGFYLIGESDSGELNVFFNHGEFEPVREMSRLIKRVRVFGENELPGLKRRLNESLKIIETMKKLVDRMRIHTEQASKDYKLFQDLQEKFIRLPGFTIELQTATILGSQYEEFEYESNLAEHITSADDWTSALENSVDESLYTAKNMKIVDKRRLVVELVKARITGSR